MALLDKISRVSLYLLVFLFALWFLPFTQNAVDYPKQLLLVAFVFFGVMAWLVKMVYKGEAMFRPSKLHILGAAVLAATGISTFFSLWRYGSFWGWPLDVTDSFLAILA